MLVNACCIPVCAVEGICEETSSTLWHPLHLQESQLGWREAGLHRVSAIWRQKLWPEESGAGYCLTGTLVWLYTIQASFLAFSLCLQYLFLPNLDTVVNVKGLMLLVGYTGSVIIMYSPLPVPPPPPPPQTLHPTPPFSPPPPPPPPHCCVCRSEPGMQCQILVWCVVYTSFPVLALLFRLYQSRRILGRRRTGSTLAMPTPSITHGNSPPRSWSRFWSRMSWPTSSRVWNPGELCLTVATRNRAGLLFQQNTVMCSMCSSLS